MAVRNDLSETIRRIVRFLYWFPKSLSTSRRRTVKFVWKSPDCRYTCHAHCQDLVHLGCRQNGKLMDCLPPHDTLDPFYSSAQGRSELIKDAQWRVRLRSRAEEGAIALYGCL